MKLSTSITRRLTQFASLLTTNAYTGAFVAGSIYRGPAKGFCVPFLNCYACPTAVFSCPIGALQHFAAMGAVPFYLLGFLLLMGLTVGRTACGWLCPFGLIQDLMNRLPSPKFTLPRRLKYVKYPVLILMVGVLPYLTGEIWFSKVCPAGTLFAGIPWVVWNPVNPETGAPVLSGGPGIMFYFSLLILALFLAWFVLVKRPFCRVFCPMGAILALFSRFSPVGIEVRKACDGCNSCRSLCPMDLDPGLDFDSEECIRCFECTRCDHVRVKTLLPEKTTLQAGPAPTPSTLKEPVVTEDV